MEIQVKEVWTYEGDPCYGDIFERIEGEEVVKGYRIHQGRRKHFNLTCVPGAMVQQLIWLVHPVHHAGPERHLMVFEQHFECTLEAPVLKKKTEQICRLFPLCQALKSNKALNKTLEFYPIPPQVFNSLAMYFVHLTAVKYEGWSLTLPW